jgi:hypothetical protein
MNQKSVKDLPGYPFEDPYKGDFTCYKQQLTSLEGCPQIVKGYFYCSNNKLQSLQYCPQIVKGDFYCSDNKLQSLQYCPQVVKGNLNCYNNDLQTLQYCPQIVKGNFNCNDNKLPSLQHIHKYCNQIDRKLSATRNPIKSHVLGVMLIEKLLQVSFDNKDVNNIINPHLKTYRDVFICQDDLIKAGYPEYAQL